MINYYVQVTAYEILDETFDPTHDQQDEVGTNVGVGPNSTNVNGATRRSSIGTGTGKIYLMWVRWELCRGLGRGQTAIIELNYLIML